MFSLTIKGLWAHKVALRPHQPRHRARRGLHGRHHGADRQSMQKTFDGVVASANAGTDVIVRHAEAIDGEFSSDSRARVDAALVDRVAAVDGVGDGAGSIQGHAQLVAGRRLDLQDRRARHDRRRQLDRRRPAQPVHARLRPRARRPTARS